MASDSTEIAAVVINRSLEDRRRVLPHYRPRPNPFRFPQLYLYLDNRIFHPSRDAMEQVDLKDRLEGCLVVESKPIFDDIYFRFNEEDTKLLQWCNIDVLLMFWSGLPADPVLPLARHGVWSFLDHERLFTGHAPIGFWEVLNQHPVTTQCLQVQRAGSPKPMILHQYHGPTNLRSIKLSRNNLLWKSVPFVSRKLNELHRVDSVDALTTIQERGERAPLEGAPSNLKVVGPIASHVSRFLRNRRMERKYVDQWILAYKFSSSPGVFDHNFDEYDVLLPPKDRYWADPFPVTVDNRSFLFFEEFLYSEAKGHLCVAAIDKDGLKEEPKILLKLEYHLSYPFVFSWQGEWYLIPESQEGNGIDVYKFDSFPYKVSYYKTIMEGVKAADTTLFEADGRWWMFAAVASHGTENLDELFLFHADSPFDPWLPHPNNPIKSDVRSARPAGRVFAQEGKYYRPSQDCSRRYGYAIRLQQIKVLSEVDYVEEEVEVILPDWSPGIVATHTINFDGALNVIDAQRRLRR
jgi:hypothetical protein